MSHDLISIDELEARSGKEYVGTALAQATAAIADASGLVRLIAESDFHDADGNLALPGAIRPVVVAMVRRALEVPVGAAAGLTGEQVGAYGWQQNPGGAAAASLFATKREVRIIRKAAGTSSLKSKPIETPYTSTESDDVFALIEAE